jgi:hypothetical protein
MQPNVFEPAGLPIDNRIRAALRVWKGLTALHAILTI